MKIDAELVRRLIDAQFPQWKHLALRAVDRQGWDNRSFRLGDAMAVRMPSAEHYASQVETEQRWLPSLASGLPVAIPRPIAMGEPMFGYPWRWSVYAWIEGRPVDIGTAGLWQGVAMELAEFLVALQDIDAAGGPAPGAHNFHRGGPLVAYDAEVHAAIGALGLRIDAPRARALWRDALESRFPGPPAWVHGDIAPGNLLEKEGRLAGVIDFGCTAVGDPSCDLAIAWTSMAAATRGLFLSRLEADPAMVARARGWALWKGLIVAAGIAPTNAVEWSRPFEVLKAILSE